MTPPQLLETVQTGDFVGEYVAPVAGSDTKVPVLDVYEGEVPSEVREELEGSDVQIYEFKPIPGGERDIMGEPFAVAAVGGIKEKDGEVGAKLTLVVPGPESYSHTDTPNPVLEGGARFGRLLEVLTRKDRVDHVDMKPENTNLTTDEMRMLGFSAVEGDPDVLRLELPDDHRPAAAA